MAQFGTGKRRLTESASTQRNNLGASSGTRTDYPQQMKMTDNFIRKDSPGSTNFHINYQSSQGGALPMKGISSKSIKFATESRSASTHGSLKKGSNGRDPRLKLVLVKRGAGAGVDLGFKK
jgi:hypothetical protein